MIEKKQITIKGIGINYKIIGGGPTILILHGWGSKSDRWAQVSGLLSQHNFSVIVPDLPGFGKSDAPPTAWNAEDYCKLIEQFVQKIGLQTFYLIGHSFGGGVAGVYATKFPFRIEKLVLVASAVFRRKTVRKAVFRIIAYVFGLFSFLPFYGLFRKAFYRFIIKKSDYPHASGVMKETYKKVIGSDLSSYLPSIQAPTLIIWGDKDDVIPVTDAYLIQEKIRNSQVMIISGGDHYIEQHMPELLAENIREFIR